MKKKILIIKLSSMGDIIFNIPLANILKKNDFEVHWLTTEKGFDLINNNPCVDKAILAPIEKWKKEKNFIKNTVEFFEIIKELKKEKYDIVLDTQMRIKSLFFTRFCGANRRIISKDAKELSILGANEIIPKIKDGFETHIVFCYLKFAKYLGLSADEIILTLPDYSNEAKDIIEFVKSKSDSSKKTLVIAPATTWYGKHWNKYSFRYLALKLQDEYNLIFTGTEKDTELIDFIKPKNALNLAGKTNLFELVEILKTADLVISLDSGTTHLAWAVQKPKILSIYCATPKSLYAPIGDKYIALESTNCKPCHHKKCTKKEKYSCTFSPHGELVYEKVKELLDKN